jgi:phenylalanyl-tRNA synthetase alpha chain
MYQLTEEGRRYLQEGLPEERLLKVLKVPRPISGLKGLPDFNIGMMWAKKKGWVKVESGRLVPIKKTRTSQETALIRAVSEGKEITRAEVKLLLSRNIVEEARDVYSHVRKLEGKTVANLTADMVRSGVWKKVRLRPYNVSAPGKPPFPGKRHPLTILMEKTREIFFDLGFQEASGPLVESSFWNFDALYQPQDHPARDLADTFYLSVPSTARLPGKGLVDAVKKVHENGGNTGSTGWKYAWDPGLARRPVLRTHTTAVSARSLLEIEPPAKVFCIGRVFRNEAIDYKSLPEFVQVEGIVVDENVGFRDLLGYLKEFYLRMGFEKIRFRPAYFPYTEMSVEPEVYFPSRKSWIELGGAGIFRPEVTQPFGIDCPVLAWGLGLERLAMLKLGLKDLRDFYYRNDLGLLRKAPIWL